MSSEVQTTAVRSRDWGELAQRLALPAVWLALVILFGILQPDTFLTSRNMANILGSQAVIVVLTLGILIPLTAGDFDLSVAFNLTLSAMLIAILNVEHGMPIVLAILIALAVGAMIGTINGALVVLLGIDSLIVTLGTGTFIGGVVLWVSDSNTISGVSQQLVELVIVHRILGVPLEFFYGLALCLAIWYVFEFTPLGRRMLFVGRGRNVARLAGVRVARLRWGALIVSGVIAALAGALYAGTTGAADPSSGTSYLLPAFAAAFLGSTTIMPGRFNPWGALIAVYTLATGITGLQLAGVPSYVQNLFYGGALVIAVALSQLARRREARDADLAG
jgi:ribose transport system permease protein